MPKFFLGHLGQKYKKNVNNFPVSDPPPPLIENFIIFLGNLPLLFGQTQA